MSREDLVPEEILLETLSLETKSLGRIVPALDTKDGVVRFGFRIDGKCYTSNELLKMSTLPARHVIKTLLMERLEQAKGRIEEAMAEIQKIPDEV